MKGFTQSRRAGEFKGKRPPFWVSVQLMDLSSDSAAQRMGIHPVMETPDFSAAGDGG